MLNNLFEKEDRKEINISAPFADRVRPQTIDDIIGQEHLIGKNSPLRNCFERGIFPSMVLWGPPGVGKTTIAQMISYSGNYNFSKLTATDSGVKEVRAVIQGAESKRKSGKKNLLFIDEIHRFNKSQQDALLSAVEKGIITLVGATTENPSFDVNSALLSRCQVYKLELLTKVEIEKLLTMAISRDPVYSEYEIQIQDMDYIYKITGGDARAALNSIELCVNMFLENNSIIITKELLEKALQSKTARYDKAGEAHYDTISAFIKSLRGSDPDAAMLWLAKMLDAGEDPKFIARRMVIFASEDIGNAAPQALQIALSVFQAVTMIGMPEARINLAQGVTYLASAPKSNASYLAIDKALKDVKNTPILSVPLHLRNAPTKLMKDEGYGKNYKYPHDFDGHFVEENYFPIDFNPKVYYSPNDIGQESIIKERLKKNWKNRY